MFDKFTGQCKNACRGEHRQHLPFFDWQWRIFRPDRSIEMRRATRKWALECLVDAQSESVQSLTWDAVNRRLFWVDSHKVQLCCVELLTGVIRAWPLPCAAGPIALRRDGRIVIVLVDGAYILNVQSHDLHYIASLDFDWQGCSVRGKTGPDGALWISVADVNGQVRLLRLAEGGSFRQIAIPGGINPTCLGWATDGRGMHWIDATRRTMGRWCFDPAQGAISAGWSVSIEDEIIDPVDGLVDADGCYWLCDGPTHTFSRFRGDGSLAARVAVDARAPTSCCFGGTDMRLLFVGTGRRGLKPQVLASAPSTGGIFMVRLHTSGAPIRAFGEAR